ncbi:hypothetical protein B4902_22005 [Yersinia frederiksenii]|nr:hypothetical protein B4902_22005 [Yersinia frederiksenii]
MVLIRMPKSRMQKMVTNSNGYKLMKAQLKYGIYLDILSFNFSEMDFRLRLKLIIALRLY